MIPFALHEPGSVAEASELLESYGPASQAFAGGTELLILQKLGLVAFEHMVNLKKIAALRGISYDDRTGQVRIGATTTHREIERSPTILQQVPILAEVERQVANVRVRNTGTLGGNLCFADPHSDPATILLSLGAELVLQQGTEARSVPIGNFFVDAYATVREPGELLVQVVVPRPPSTVAMAYERLCVYERPTANVAVLLQLDEAGERVASLRVAAGSVGPVPASMAAVESALVGEPLDGSADRFDEALGEAVEDLDVLEDSLGSAEYKRHLVHVLGRRAFRSASASVTRNGRQENS